MASLDEMGKVWIKTVPVSGKVWSNKDRKKQISSKGTKYEDMKEETGRWTRGRWGPKPGVRTDKRRISGNEGSRS